MGVISRLEDVCRWEDNIKMNLQGIGRGPGLDSSSPGDGQGGGLFFF